MTTEKKKVFVLTRSVSDYNQHGDYFVAVFAARPSVKALAEHFYGVGFNTGHMDMMAAIAFLEHVRAGGGRRGTEDEWYDLEEKELVAAQ